MENDLAAQLEGDKKIKNKAHYLKCPGVQHYCTSWGHLNKKKNIVNTLFPL